MSSTIPLLAIDWLQLYFALKLIVPIVVLAAFGIALGIAASLDRMKVRAKRRVSHKE